MKILDFFVFFSICFCIWIGCLCFYKAIVIAFGWIKEFIEDRRKGRKYHENF